MNRLNEQTKETYISPTLRAIEIKVQQCIAQSGSITQMNEENNIDW